MSWDLGGHTISGWLFPDAHSIQRPGNTVFRYWRTSQWKWAGLSPCWNMNVGMPQLQNIPTFIFQQDGKSRPLPLEVRQYLNSVTRTLDRACAWKWPTADAMAPEVPWHYAMWFFLWGYVKDRLFVPTLPRDLDGQRARIIATVKNIDAPMLTRVWQELAYRIDVCRAARGAHIEKL